MYLSLRLASISLAVVLCSYIAYGATRSAKPKTGRVAIVIIASGSKISSTFSGNQDDYLIKVILPHRAPIFASLRHRYPHYRDGLDMELLNSGRPFKARAVRDRSCDLSYQDFANALQADSNGRATLLAILRPVSVEPIPQIPSDAVLPCYLLEQGR